MKGTELLLRLKEKQPKMVEIAITGFPSLGNASKTVNESTNGYVLKLFDAEELLKIIRKQLDEKAAEQVRTWIAKFEMERKNTVFSEQLKKPKGSLFSR
jgi:DNA-binding NtrC family response regulator